MYSKINYTVVGFFVLIFTTGFIWFAFWLAKYGLQEEYDYYRIEMSESVSGLSKDSAVKLRGVDVGSVSEIRINPVNVERVEIILKIIKGTPIKEDMVVFTEMYGVTGLTYLQIGGGTNDAKLLQPKEGEMPTIPTSASLISKVGTKFDTLSGKLSFLLERGTVLLSKENINKIEHILENVERITGTGEAVELKAIASLGEADQTLEQFRASMRDINDSFQNAMRDFEQMQQDFASIKKVTVPTVDKLMQTSRNFNRVTLKVEQSLERGDYNLKGILEPMLIEIEILSDQLHDLAVQLEQSPSDLLFKTRKAKRGPGE